MLTDIPENIVNKIREEAMLTELAFSLKAAKEIHEERTMFDYTDHGIEHSKRILDFLNQLCADNLLSEKKNSLNKTETFILCVSVYLHDIGMQVDKDNVLELFAEEQGVNLNLEEKASFIRKYHHKISAWWIEKSIKRIDSCNLPLVYQGDVILARYVQQVIISHGESFLDLKEFNQSHSVKGDEVRLDVLCRLLSLGDAIDCDCRRIEFSKTKYREIEGYSLLHWYKHYYVQSVMIKNNVIEVHYTFPELEESKLKQYRGYFGHQTMYWVINNKQSFLNCLKKYGCVYDVEQKFGVDSNKEALPEELYSDLENEVAEVYENIDSNILGFPAKLKVSIGILVKGGKILMTKRKNPEGKLQWQFPAGVVKPSQSAESRIISELYEETNISAEIVELLGKRIHPDTKVYSIYYGMKYLKGRIKNKDKNENDEVAWVDIKKYKELITSDLYFRIDKWVQSQK